MSCCHESPLLSTLWRPPKDQAGSAQHSMALQRFLNAFGGQRMLHETLEAPGVSRAAISGGGDQQSAVLTLDSKWVRDATAHLDGESLPLGKGKNVPIQKEEEFRQKKKTYLVRG